MTLNHRTSDISTVALGTFSAGAGVVFLLIALAVYRFRKRQKQSQPVPNTVAAEKTARQASQRHVRRNPFRDVDSPRLEIAGAPPKGSKSEAVMPVSDAILNRVKPTSRLRVQSSGLYMIPQAVPFQVDSVTLTVADIRSDIVSTPILRVPSSAPPASPSLLFPHQQGDKQLGGVFRKKQKPRKDLTRAIVVEGEEGSVVVAPTALESGPKLPPVSYLTSVIRVPPPLPGELSEQPSAFASRPRASSTRVSARVEAPTLPSQMIWEPGHGLSASKPAGSGNYMARTAMQPSHTRSTPTRSKKQRARLESDRLDPTRPSHDSRPSHLKPFSAFEV